MPGYRLEKLVLRLTHSFFGRLTLAAAYTNANAKLVLRDRAKKHAAQSRSGLHVRTAGLVTPTADQ